MIAVDTSALAAILFGEDDAKRFTEVLSENDVVIGAPSRFEFLMVASGRTGDFGLSAAHDLLAAFQLKTIAWDADMADEAVRAFERFGRGRRSRAKLNFGDCMAYALAKSLDAPLLFKGDDFTHTDIESAL